MLVCWARKPVTVSTLIPDLNKFFLKGEGFVPSLDETVVFEKQVLLISANFLGNLLGEFESAHC